jgi:hypothetical protein
MALMNGNLIYRSKEYVLLTFGQEKFDQILSEMEESARKILSETVNSSEMYNTRIYQEYLRACEKILGRPEINNMSKYCLKKQITGLYGFVLKFLSVERAFANSQMMWDKSYTEGKIEVTNKDNTKFTMKILEFEMNDSMMYGCLYYVQALLVQVTEKKVISSAKRIDKSTVEFTFSILLK